MAFNCGEDPDVLREKWSERSLRSLGILFAHEPPAEERLDFWMPQLLAANINPWRKSRTPAVDPKDLAPDWWGVREKVRTTEQWVDLLKGMAVAFGGKV